MLSKPAQVHTPENEEQFEDCSALQSPGLAELQNVQFRNIMPPMHLN